LHFPGQAYGPACTLPGERTFGNALLSRFPILVRRTLALPNPLGREPRSLLCCLLALPGAQLPVFVTHLDWELDGSYARCQQVRFIADQIDLFVAAAKESPHPYGGDLLPPILAGDFNAEPDSDEIRFLTGRHALPGPPGPPGPDGAQAPRGVYFNDCYVRAVTRPSNEQADGDVEGATFSRHNPFAARAHEPDRRLDYVFVGLPDAHGRGQPLRAWRCLKAPYAYGGVFASDHFGVAVDLALALLSGA
jgi:endonuclease/exonuclease/phosphatase family metal-dependent hydrolase